MLRDCHHHLQIRDVSTQAGKHKYPHPEWQMSSPHWHQSVHQSPGRQSGSLPYQLHK